jgi:acyl carrier protein
MTDTEKLDHAYRSSLGLGDDADLTDMAYGKTEGWDSVAHMQLVAAIETTFEIMMDTDDVVAMSSYQVSKRILRDNHGLDLDA